MTIIAQRTAEKVLANGNVLLADAQLHHIEGNERPHFALTGELWKRKGDLTRHRNNPDYEGGLIGLGAMGDVIADELPEFAIIERLHLADDDGAPLHAVANGWYFYSGKAHEYERNSPYHIAPTDTPHERGARYLRVDPADLPEDMSRDEFEEFVETLRPRWKVEADKAIAFLRGEV